MVVIANPGNLASESRRRFRHLVKRMARTAGLGIVDVRRLDQLAAMESDSRELFDLVARAHRIHGETRAQLRQDLFVLLETNFKQNGFFVEFGATDGRSLSNTHLLEKRYGWHGILAEPATVWHESLKINRSAAIDHDCVWSESGKTLKFRMITERPAFSTISDFSNSDHHAEARTGGIEFDVKTVSLLDLLRRHNAPKQIDYLSIDTEGSELEILSHFDFDAYDISIITCEHNHAPHRDDVFELLTAKGYERKLAGVSKWDDWYVRSSPKSSMPDEVA